MILALLRLLALPLLPIQLLALVLAALIVRLLPRSARPRLVWGPVPILNNKYWSRAMAEGGFVSETLVQGLYAINTTEDFDRYLPDLLGLPARAVVFDALWYWAFCYALFRYDVFHIPFSGGYLGRTRLWRIEAALLALAGKKTVVLPYGADAYMPSRIIDPALRHAFLSSYPQYGRDEVRTQARVSYWAARADAIVTGIFVDGMGRWDAIPVSHLTIDTRQWSPREHYSPHDGRSGPVRVLHTPNHRGFKGTEFLLAAVEVLKSEGLQVELLLAEKLPNAEVRRIMQDEADLLAEQFFFTGYALSGIEGMACGLPVMANLDHPDYTRLFRRCSYLDNCPVLSSTPERLVEDLRLLVTDPALRETLGRAGRQYVEYFHSAEAARFLFGAIYESIWHGRDVNLMDLFHPLKGPRPLRVEHPLVDGRLPK